MNPIATVRQSAARLKDPEILSQEEIRTIMKAVEKPVHRTMILVAAVTGFRRSELRGLKWGDIDFDGLWIKPQRGRIGKKKSKMKSPASRRKIPMSPDLATVLHTWREQSLYRAEDDWVFASEKCQGRVPMWLDMVMSDYIKPAAKLAGITKRFSWHTFRHSLACLLAHKNENPKVAQELLRHANVQTTMQIYQQAYSEDKRAAQGHTSGLFLVA